MYLTDKPGPPQNLGVTNYTENSVSIKYEPPEDDGGTEVTGYVIERREAKRTNWNNAMSSPDLDYTITKLTKGKQYYFRVAAENKMGVGPFVETQEPVTAKSAFGELLFRFI